MSRFSFPPDQPVRRHFTDGAPWVLEATLTPAAEGGSNLVGTIRVPRSLRVFTLVAVLVLMVEVVGMLLGLLALLTGPPALADWFSSLATLVGAQLVVLLAVAAWSGRHRHGARIERGPADQVLQALVAAVSEPNRRPGILPSASSRG